MAKSAIIIMILLFSSFNLSQESWVKLNGPQGGVIAGLIAKGDTLLAGTGNGLILEHGSIFYSTNKGNNWIKSDLKVNRQIADFAFTNDGGIIAAASNYGVVKSYDLHNWFKIHNGGPNYDFICVGVGEEENIYAGCYAWYFLNSTNNGATWQMITNMQDGGCYDLIYFKGNSYLSYSDKIYKKQEPNGQWLPSFEFTIDNRFTFTNDSSTLYAPSWNYFHLSSDNGTTWVQRDSSHILFNNQLYNCVYNSHLIGTCYDVIGISNLWGIIISNDGGYTWNMSNAGLMPKISGYCLAVSGTDTYVGTKADGVYKSTDFGYSWSSINNGLYAADVCGFDIDNAGNFYSAAYGSGISKSTDNGFSWVKINNGFQMPYMFDVLAYDSLKIFVGTYEGLYMSTNGGENFTKAPPIGSDYILKFFRDRQNRIYLIDYSTGLYRSSDGGTIWSRIMNNLDFIVMSVAFDSTGNIYAGTRSGRIYKSTNDGASWMQVFHYTTSHATVNGICVAPNGSIFATAHEYGIVRSTDNGVSWTRVKTTTGFYGIWPIETNTKGDIYTCGIDSIFFSQDNGDTWKNITSNGILLTVKDIVFDKQGYVYLATDESVWRSADPTPVELTQFKASVAERDVLLNWETSTESNNKGFEIQRKTLPLSGGRQASHSPPQGEGDDWVMVSFVNGAGTSSETHSYSYIDKSLETGNYTYRLKQVDFDGSFEYSKEIEVEVNSPAEFSLKQNYPNPFNPTTTIEFSLPKDGNVKLSLYNVLGEELKVLINEKMTPGEHKYTLNASTLPSGVYMYRITAGEFSDTRKLIVIK